MKIFHCPCFCCCCFIVDTISTVAIKSEAIDNYVPGQQLYNHPAHRCAGPKCPYFILQSCLIKLVGDIFLGTHYFKTITTSFLNMELNIFKYSYVILILAIYILYHIYSFILNYCFDQLNKNKFRTPEYQIFVLIKINGSLQVLHY